MKLRDDPLHAFRNSKTPADMYACRKWPGEAAPYRWRLEFQDCMLVLNWRKAFLLTALFTIVLAFFVNGCAVTQGETAMQEPDRLAPCPDRPNCVSSDARDRGHAIAPMRLLGDVAGGWEAVKRIVDQMPRSTIVAETDAYLHATFRSRLFRFVDDLELKLDRQTGIIAVRSASRVGYSDLGVNRRRVESLRRRLTAEKLIQ
jgi:uncharacterized protein (DUF1499 family)